MRSRNRTFEDDIECDVEQIRQLIDEATTSVENEDKPSKKVWL